MHVITGAGGRGPLAKNVVFRDHWQGLEDGPEEWRSRRLGPQLRRDLSRIALAVDAASPTGAVRVYRAIGYTEVQRSTVWQRPLLVP